MLRMVVTTCTVTLLASLLASCETEPFVDTSSGGDGVAASERAPVFVPAEGDGIALPIKPGEPCYRAKRHSLSELAALADVPVWLPQSPSASEAVLTGAWTCAGGDTPVLTFGPVTISYESGYPTALPWGRKAADSGGEVRTILGQAGLLMPSTSPSVKGEVMVIVDDGVLVRVLGEPDVPPKDLVAVADSLRLDAPVEP